MQNRSTTNAEPVELCHRYPTNFEVETLPSYTIVSGLPTYDDALEEFRKAGIVLTSPSFIPMSKLFEQNLKTGSTFDLQDATNVNGNDLTSRDQGQEHDNISINSNCTCGANRTNNFNTPMNPNINGSMRKIPPAKMYSAKLTPNSTYFGTWNLPAAGNSAVPVAATPSPSPSTKIVELTPEQLVALSQKRLSLQFALSNSPATVRRGSQRMNLYREANRNNLMRSRALMNNESGNLNTDVSNSQSDSETYVPRNSPNDHHLFPGMHRSLSSTSIERNSHRRANRSLNYLQHRGSLY